MLIQIRVLNSPTNTYFCNVGGGNQAGAVTTGVPNMPIGIGPKSIARGEGANGGDTESWLLEK